MSNPRLLVVLNGLHFTLFPIPVITLYWKDQGGLSLTDIMVLQAIFGMTVVLFEFPSGYFADRVGYRRSLVVGTALWVAGWGVYAGGAGFLQIAIAEMLLGAGGAFVSGADRALLWTSLDEDGRSARYTRWDGRMRAAAQTSEALSAAVGGWLYAVAPRLPFWLQIPVAATAVGSAAMLRDVPLGHHGGHRSHLGRALGVVRFALWEHRRLQGALALGVALGLSTFVMVWLIQPYMQGQGIAAAWFGPIWAGAHAWLALVSLASARVVRRLGVTATLGACCALVALGYVGLAASTSVWGVLFYLCFMTVRGLQGPILSRVMQEDAPGGDRASVLSLAALLFRLAFVIAGPAVGALVDRAGMTTALAVLAACSAALTAGAFGRFARAHRARLGCRGS